MLYLGFYPPAYVGVVLLARPHLRQFRPSLWLDGVIGALTVAAVARRWCSTGCCRRPKALPR